MTVFLRPLLLLCLALTLVPAQFRDEKKIKRLEGVVTKTQAELDQSVAELRKVYRTLKDSLAECQVDQGAKAIADLARVLEPVITKAKTLAGSGTTLNKRRVSEELKKSVPRAVSNVEHTTLTLLKDYLPRRVLGVMRESGNVLDSLELEVEDLSRRVLKEILAFDTPFHIRWNAYLAGVLEPVKGYRRSFKTAEDARLDLAEAKDPFLKFQRKAPAGFAWIPVGDYTMVYSGPFARTGPRKRPKRARLGKRVLIGLKEVTHAEYYAWLKDQEQDFFSRHQPRDGDGKPLWKADKETGLRSPEKSRLEHPVVGVTLQSALLYAQSRGARLPTELEWHIAASGPKNREWPWGDEYKPELANDREAALKDTVPVGSYPAGRGPYGHWDLAGNVAEWTLTYESTKDIAPDPQAIDDANCVIRGGSYKQGSDGVRSDWVWLRATKDDRGMDLGFRLAMDDPEGK